MKTYLIRSGDFETKVTQDTLDKQNIHLRARMINHLDMSLEYEVYTDELQMKAIDIIKRLCDHRSEIFKKVLCFEFLQDINYHKEAEIINIALGARGDLMEWLWLLSRKGTFDKKTWDFLNEKWQIDLYEKGLKDLMTKEGNFRVAVSPFNNYIACWYDAFREYWAAQSLYTAVSVLWEYGYAGDGQEIVDYALAPNDY